MRVLIISGRYHGGGAERCGRELFERLPQHGIATDLWLSQRDPKAPRTVRQLPLQISTLLDVGKQQARRMRHKLRPQPPVDHRPAVDPLVPTMTWEQGRTLHDGSCAETEVESAGVLTVWERIVQPLTDLRHVGFRRRVGRLENRDVDVVHLHAGYPWCASIRALWSLCQRVPVVWTLHDDWAATGGILHDLSETLSAEDIQRLVRNAGGGPGAATYHRRFQKDGERRFLDRWMPQPATLVAPSAHLTRKAHDSGRFPQSQIFQVPNGVSLLEERRVAMERTAARKALGLATNRPVILMIAANPSVVHKGFRLGAAAINRLHSASQPRPQVLLLGHGGESLQPLFPNCELRTRYASSSAELATAYRAADLTLIPSLTENFPYVALESLACRTPVVGFRVGGMSEIVDQRRGGALVAPFDIRELSRRCSELLASPEDRDRLAEAGHQWVAEHCDMTLYLRRMHAVYQDAIDRFHGSHEQAEGRLTTRRAA